MSPFVLLSWPEADGRAAAAADRFEAAVEAAGSCKLLYTEANLRLYAGVRPPIRWRLAAPRGDLVLGDLFTRDGADADLGRVADGASSCAVRAGALLDRCWGRYGAVLRDGAGALAGLLRDPSGAVEMMTWCACGVRVVTSRVQSAWLPPLKPPVEIDWDVVRCQLEDASLLSASAALRGIHTVTPGAYLDLATGGERQVWRPSGFVLNGEIARPAAARDLRSRVETCVAAHARGAGPILTEVSGGLDSSIVAVCLQALPDPSRRWIHHSSEERGGDERAFVACLAQALDLVVEDRPKRPFAVEPHALARTQTGVRPSLAALDPVYDADLAALAQADGIARIFTGMAGDGLFFLSASPAIAVDMVRRRGARALLSGEFRSQARWMRRSVWRLARQVAMQSFLRNQPPGRPSAWLTPGSRPLPLHPWLADATALAPAKLRHVHELVHALSFYGESLRAEACDVVHPLLSQPIMEHVLRLPADLLTHGGRDRALAREAFRGKLPAALLERRSKGELGPYYSRAFAQGLPGLRDYLLDGRLVREGVLRRSPLEAVLDEAHLAQFGGAGTLLAVAAIEGWARHWNALAAGSSDGADPPGRR